MHEHTTTDCLNAKLTDHIKENVILSAHKSVCCSTAFHKYILYVCVHMRSKSIIFNNSFNKKKPSFPKQQISTMHENISECVDTHSEKFTVVC